MLELYVVLTLASIGYLLNKTTTVSAQTKGATFPKSEKPSMNNMYESKFSQDTLKETGKKAHDMYEMSRDPKKTGVISMNYPLMKEERVQTMDGRYVSSDTFRRNDRGDAMVPFFGGTVKQNIEPFSTGSLMATKNGTDHLYQQKREVKSFYDKCENVGNVNGMPSQQDYYMNRMTPSKLKTNETPIPKVYVGPGIGKGFTSSPTGGFQQLDAREYAMPKCVDELRVKSKPKVTYDGVVLEGQKSILPAEPIRMDKNRPERFWEKSPDSWFTTTGAFTKQKQNPEQIMKDTNRQDTNIEYKGVAFAHDRTRRTVEPVARDPNRVQLEGFDVGNAALSKIGVGTKADYGKSQIMVYDNERDITSTKVYTGNLTSLIKAIVTPFTDFLDVTKKDEFIDNPRHFGNVNIQIPNKGTIYDPNDVARTTIKESLIHDSMIGNLNGPKQLMVYDPDDIARSTLRQTMDPIETTMNLKGKNANMAYNDDPAKKTLKETLIDNERYGNINNLEGGGGYETTEWDARMTQKALLADNDYYGQVGFDGGKGYLTNPKEARLTQKAFMSDNDYYGTAVGDRKEFSKEAMMNANITPNKEVTLFKRDPTEQGQKEFAGKEAYNIVNRKTEIDYKLVRESPNTDRVYNEIPSSDEVGITKMKKDYRQIGDERLDIDILKSALDNPFNIHING